MNGRGEGCKKELKWERKTMTNFLKRHTQSSAQCSYTHRKLGILGPNIQNSGDEGLWRVQLVRAPSTVM